MRDHRLTVCILTLTVLLMLIPLQTAQCQNYVEYDIQIRDDGSAVWSVNQFSPANASTVDWADFQQKVYGLVYSAQSITQRDMDVDGNSFQINTTITAESKITEYSFLWRNFTVNRDSTLQVGDVFGAEDFFGQLFGDAALQLSYPAEYRVKSVYPPPYERQDAAYTLKWARTEDLTNTNVNIVLAQGSGDGSPAYSQNGFMVILVVAIVVVVSALGIYAVKRKRNNAASAQEPQTPSALETEEDKIIKLLKTSGGALRQTEITERCNFSKAKTSQLLTALEGMGKLTRYKKGRDKIVTLNERVKEEKP
jgi:uncharacterized membrane protein